MKRFFVSFSFAILFLSFPFLYKEATGGFRLSKLHHPYPISEKASQIAMSDELKGLLKQPFYYLNRGMQTFVFESRDGDIVVKFFKLRRRAKREHFLKTLKACQLAFDLAREETGLLYTHLYSNGEKLPRIRLKNRLGISLSLPLEKYAFVIQRKAKPFDQFVSSSLRSGELSSLIDAYLNLVYKRSQKGICNTDVHVQRNFGWLDGKALEIDFGNYQYAPEKKEIEFCQFAGCMRSLLEKHAPEKLAEYDQKVAAYR